MTKNLYLLILLLIGLQFFGLTFFTPLYASQFAYPVILGTWLYYGYHKWGKGQFKYFKRELKYWMWMLIGICSSMFTIYINIGQTIFHSFWIYRNILIVYCCFPVLLFIRIPYKDIIKTTYQFSFIYAIVFFLVTMFPYLKSGTIDETGELRAIAETDFGYVLSGLELLLFPLYSYLMQYTKTRDVKKLYRIFFLLALIFFIQNRSVLFFAVLISCILLWRGFSNLKRLVMLAIAISVLLVPSLNPFEQLIEQTERETRSEEYNRNIAYAYYIGENFSSFQQFLCGQGYESSHLSNQKIRFEELASLGIYPSDVGMLGFMNIYGVIPVIVFAIILFKPLVKWRYYSVDIRCMAIHILICSATISFFESFSHTIWFALFFTLLSMCEKRHYIQENTRLFHASSAQSI